MRGKDRGSVNPSWIPFQKWGPRCTRPQNRGRVWLAKTVLGFLSQRGDVGAWGGVAQRNFISVAYFNTPPWRQCVGLEPGESKRNLTNYSFSCVGWIIEFVGCPHRFLLFSRPPSFLSDQRLGQGAQCELICQGEMGWEQKPNGYLCSTMSSLD